MIMFGYNGQYPGPLIQAPKDATVMVRVTNEIQMPTTIHWHGLRIANAMDVPLGNFGDSTGIEMSELFG